MACLPKTTLQVVVAFVGMTGSETESSSWVYQLNSCHGLIQDLTYHWCHLNALSLDFWPLDGCGESSFFWFWGVKHTFFFFFEISFRILCVSRFQTFFGKVSEKDMSSQGDLTSWKFNVYICKLLRLRGGVAPLQIWMKRLWWAGSCLLGQFSYLLIFGVQGFILIIATLSIDVC